MNNIIFLILILIIIIMLILFINKRDKNIENYKGLSKVKEFEDALEKKYTKINKDEKIVTQCDISGVCQEKSYKYHFNSPSAVKLVKDKIETATILQKNVLPIPVFFKQSLLNDDIEDSLKDLKENMKKHKITFPIVLKQIHGTFGIDVFTHIDDDIKAKSTLNTLKNKGYSEVMCEEQIDGACYRIFVFNGNIIDIIKREAPYIIGDGINDVKSLIEMRNKNQLEKKLFKTNNISTHFIESQGYNMNSILPKDKRLIISTVINMHNGANISRVNIDTLPKDNR